MVSSPCCQRRGSAAHWRSGSTLRFLEWRVCVCVCALGSQLQTPPPAQNTRVLIYWRFVRYLSWLESLFKCYQTPPPPTHLLGALGEKWRNVKSLTATIVFSHFSQIETWRGKMLNPFKCWIPSNVESLQMLNLFKCWIPSNVESLAATIIFYSSQIETSKCPLQNVEHFLCYNIWIARSLRLVLEKCVHLLLLFMQGILKLPMPDTGALASCDGAVCSSAPN